MIYNFNTSESPPINVIGGKAKNLIITTQAGLPVPEGFALAVSYFSEWTKGIKNSEEWKGIS
jgi:phosphoenolpyruvate synthase/pyruvate phosphate dikinase